MAEAKAKKDQIIARARTAKASTKVNDMLAGVGSGSSSEPRLPASHCGRERWHVAALPHGGTAPSLRSPPRARPLPTLPFRWRGGRSGGLRPHVGEGGAARGRGRREQAARARHVHLGRGQLARCAVQGARVGQLRRRRAQRDEGGAPQRGARFARAVVLVPCVPHSQRTAAAPHAQPRRCSGEGARAAAAAAVSACGEGREAQPSALPRGSRAPADRALQVDDELAEMKKLLGKGEPPKA
eukprot:6667581-Prymnesium_polylepis.1